MSPGPRGIKQPSHRLHEILPRSGIWAGTQKGWLVFTPQCLESKPVSNSNHWGLARLWLEVWFGKPRGWNQGHRAQIKRCRQPGSFQRFPGWILAHSSGCSGCYFACLFTFNTSSDSHLWAHVHFTLLCMYLFSLCLSLISILVMALKSPGEIIQANPFISKSSL